MADALAHALYDYSQIKYKSDPSESGLDRTDENLAIRQNFHNTINLSVGGEFIFPYFPMALRGGYRLVKSPLKNPPADMDRTVISFGAGLRLNDNLILDAAYAWTSWEKPAGEIIAAEKGNASRFLASLTWRM